MVFDLSAVESAVLNSAPGIVPELPAVLTAVDFDGTGAAVEIDGPAPLDLLSESEFLAQWDGIHDIAGGMLQQRIGAPVPLGQKARDEGGQMAGKAAYALLKSNDTLARMVLSTQSTFLGQLALIGMHGLGCVQIVKAARDGQTMPVPEPEFSSTRGAE